MKKEKLFKYGLILLSLSPVFVLTIIKNLYFSFDKQKEDFILKMPWLLGVLCVCGICFIISIFVFFTYKGNQTHGFTEGYTIKEVSEEQDAGINFFLTIVLRIIIDDLDKWQNSLTFVLIMIITIILLSKTNLYYANPVLMIFGYRVIRFKFETPPPNMNDDEYIGICPKKINASHSIKFKRIDDNVLCIKQRERRQNDNRRISPENQ